MADKIIMVDTSVLIDFYRKTDIANSLWIALVKQGHEFVISAITKYEIFSGANFSQLEFWNNVLEAIIVIPLDEVVVDIAVDINSNLKLKRKQIGIADLFIAATAISKDLSFATLNKKHFSRIDQLRIV